MYIRTVIVAAALMFTAMPAFAHYFNVLLVGEAIGTSGAYDGFRMATRERDGHANEESDGHLGGLDSYIFTTDSLAESPAIAIQNAIDIVVFLEDSASAEVAVIKVINASDLTQDTRQAMLEQLDFFARFEQEFGGEVSEAAQRAYMAAQLIEEMVRSRAILADR